MAGGAGQPRRGAGIDGQHYQTGVGEAAFYGPKIDFQVKDAHRREFTNSTVQVDFQLPERFDLEYVATTWLLSAAVREGVRVFNSPDAIRDHNEKLAIAEFGAFVAPTLVTREPARIQAFIDEQRDVVVKRLDVMGGENIFRVRLDDPNRNVIVEIMAQGGERMVMAQRYIPEISKGDNRVLLIDGQPVPHCLARIPKPGE